MSFAPVDRASQPAIRERETRPENFDSASIEGQAKNVMDQLRQELGLSRGGPSLRPEPRNLPEAQRPEVGLSDHFEKIRERISGAVTGRSHENRSDKVEALESMERPPVERLEEGIREPRSRPPFDRFDSVLKRLKDLAEVGIPENPGKGSQSHRIEESTGPQKSEPSYDKFDSALDRLKKEPRIEEHQGRGLPPRRIEERPQAISAETSEERPKETHSGDTIFQRRPR